MLDQITFNRTDKKYEWTDPESGEVLTAPAKRSASARTLEASELVGLFRSDLLEALEENPRAASNLLLGLTRVMSERLQAAGLEIRRLQILANEHSTAETIEA